MNTLDRTKAPASQQISELQYIHPDSINLTNGMQAYCINVAEQDLIRVEFLFDAGEWYQEVALQSSVCIQMLNEGSANYTSSEIAEKLDFYGSFIFLNSQKHTATVSLYSLGKYLKQSLKIVQDMLLNPCFPEKEFATIMAQKRQQFQIDNEKVEAVAAQHFMLSLYGADHPYGKIHTGEDFDRLTVDHLKSFHKKYYSSANCKLIVSGKISEGTIPAIEKYFGQSAWGNTIIPDKPKFLAMPASKKQVYLPKDHAVQTALRVGIPMINKTNPDHKGLQVLNTLLGGYFGSRLMSNIREDKGYTYGIHSSLASLQDNGYFLISSQVGKDVKQLAIDEIYKEINRLCTELIPDEELLIVKNYMLGQILRYFDGAFNLADTLKSLLDYGMNYDHYKEVVSAIQSITPEKLLELAKTYLHNKEYYEICVG